MKRPDVRLVRFFAALVVIGMLAMLGNLGLSLGMRALIWLAFVVVYAAALYEGSQS